MKNELEAFMEIWEAEAGKTVRLFDSLPHDQYDFRPDPEGRSLGELAWHLAESEGYGSFGIERRGFSREERPEGLQRPRTVPELRPAFERIHADARERVRNLAVEDLDQTIRFFTGDPMPIRDVLWNFMLLHAIHHRGQLALLCRQAGGSPVSLYGPTRESMPLRKPA